MEKNWVFLFGNFVCMLYALKMYYLHIILSRKGNFKFVQMMETACLLTRDAENCRKNSYIPVKSVVLSLFSNDARYLNV